jgi:hypothetical protein
VHPRVIWLAGDSSLDNKYWFSDSAQAVNGYETILRPPTMKQDVCYWLNRLAQERGLDQFCSINTSVEATSLNSRSLCSMLDQDEFIRGMFEWLMTMPTVMGLYSVQVVRRCCGWFVDR